MGHHIAFWAGAIVIPLLVIGANAFARIAWGRPQSAAADVVLTLVVFDFTVIINSDEFKRFVIDVLRDGIISIFCVLLILNAVSWGIGLIGWSLGSTNFMTVGAGATSRVSLGPSFRL